MNINDFTTKWINDNIVSGPHPSRGVSTSLTWFVGANALYVGYCKSAQIDQLTPLTFKELHAALQAAIPSLKTGRLKGTPVYTGIRYEPGGRLTFGV